MKLGLIGKTLEHSFSKYYFENKFQALGLDNSHSYKNFELHSIAEFPDLIQANPTLSGLNVTIPFKEEIIPFLDEIRDDAGEIGAVNCINLTNGRLIGYNYDAQGFLMTLNNQRTSIKNALILGTGGASKAVAYALQSVGARVSKVSRSNDFDLSYDELDENLLENIQIIVNTTPLGTFPDVDSYPPFPVELLNEQHFVYDLIYNPQETKFLKEAKKRGCTTQNGYGMLVNQAELSWKLWNSHFKNSEP